LSKKAALKQTEIGLMSDYWKVVNLALILNGHIKHGIYKSKECIDNSGTRILKMGVQYSNKTISNQKMERVCLSTDELNRFKIEEGDLIFSRTSMMEEGAGNVSIVIKHNDPIIFDGNLLCATLKKEIADPKFYFYYFRTKIAKQEILKITTGTQSRNIAASNLVKVFVPLPSYEEQVGIASMLSLLDSKIELNQKMNETLEIIGQVVFKRWFVDFEFPNQEGKPYKSSGGEMVYNEIAKKKIPEGWKFGTFAQMAEINKGDIVDGPFGSNLKSSDYAESGIRLIHQENIEEFKFVNTKKRFTTKEKADSLSRSIALAGDIVLTKMPEPITRAARIPVGLSERFVIMADCIRIRPHKEVTPSEFLLYLINSSRFRQEAEGKATGTTRPRINLTQVKLISILVPPKTYRLKFSDFVRSLESKRELNLLQIERLTTIRDILLPKLMSGKVRVPASKEKEETVGYA
jgi:type I restriction enzyme, S subunit